jgi:hypothetical protein
MFKEWVAVYCENHTKHTISVGRMQFQYVEAGGTYTNHWALKG